MIMRRASLAILSVCALALAACAADDETADEDSLDDLTSETSSDLSFDGCKEVFARLPAINPTGLMARGEGGVDGCSRRNDNRWYRLTASLQSCNNAGCGTIAGTTRRAYFEGGAWRAQGDGGAWTWSNWTRIQHQGFYRSRLCVDLVSGDGVVYKRGVCVNGALDRL